MSKGRTSKLTVRLTPEEYKHFLVIQRASGLSQADFIMSVINNDPLPNIKAIKTSDPKQK